MTTETKALVVAAFVVLGHARAREIDLGSAGAQLMTAMENAAPGSIARLNGLCPQGLPRRAGKKISGQFATDSRRKPRRVAKVDPVKRQAVHLH